MFGSSDMGPLALLTRPQRESEELAKLLKPIGVGSLIEPLIQIIPITNVILPPLDAFQALIVTSANGVHSLTTVLGDTPISLQNLQLFAVGSITAGVAQKYGFRNIECANGNIHSLASLVADKLKPKKGPLLHIAGTEVAGDLSALLSKLGFVIKRECIYRAVTSKTLSKEAEKKLESGEVDMVLFFSPRSAKAFTDLCLGENINYRNLSQFSFSNITAICLSQNVALVASQLNWKRIRVACRPERSAILDEVVLEAEANGSRN